ncbi:sucrose-6-phosphate hydrolase [Klebsiella pneumoniae]|uniref:beta-fructofuranosidase n=1 Tax=Klebsiella pneumoniae TaxID=573 RepID=A0A378F986_KLEPN|nr:sucrose-6-phosphate hydrolase [Klebsiella pneumoniae]
MSLPSRLPAILQAVMQGQPQALADSHYPQWHLAPVNGLLNDPNGFCQVAGRYHMFYQWNPLACDHTYKCWGHWSSADLLHWRHEPIALMPDEEYDRNGCYSGSAVEFEGALTLCYTGNVKFPDGGRTAWQCLATENADGTFRKLGPVLPLPEGYTGHVRDPKVWRQDGRWYMVLGAQDVQQRGKVLLLPPATCGSGAWWARSPARRERPGERRLHVGVPGSLSAGGHPPADLLPAGAGPRSAALSQYLSGGVDGRPLRRRTRDLRPRPAARAGQRI